MQQLLEGLGFVGDDEEALADAVAALLDRHGIEYERERRISREDRLDFFVDDLRRKPSEDARLYSFSGPHD